MPKIKGIKMIFKKFKNRKLIILLLLISIFTFGKYLQSQNVVQNVDEKIKLLQMEVQEKKYNFTVGKTSVSALPLDLICGLKEPVGWQQKAVFDKGLTVPKKLGLPLNFDWRTSGKVTPVKNQGSCGSCWDFGTIGSYEGVIACTFGELVDLSEQYILDCNSSNYSCQGGWWAFSDLANGVPLESCYPYTAVKGTNL